MTLKDDLGHQGRGLQILKVSRTSKEWMADQKMSYWHDMCARDGFVFCFLFCFAGFAKEKSFS